MELSVGLSQAFEKCCLDGKEDISQFSIYHEETLHIALPNCKNGCKDPAINAICAAQWLCRISRWEVRPKSQLHMKSVAFGFVSGIIVLAPLITVVSLN